MNVERLAPAASVSNGATAYVVWIQPTGGQPQNAGTISLNQDLSGTLKTVTALRSFDVFITPEKSSTAAEPSGPHVLHGSVRT